MIEELYLLVHPYYDKRNYNYEEEELERIWEESILANSKKKNTFGIMYFLGIGKQIGQQYNLRFTTRDISEKERGFGEFFRSNFGEERTKFVMANNLCFPEIHEDERIISSINPEKVIVTSRGIWANLCVVNAIEGICEFYNIPEENCSVIDSESVYTFDDPALELLFSQNCSYIHN